MIFQNNRSLRAEKIYYQNTWMTSVKVLEAKEVKYQTVAWIYIKKWRVSEMVKVKINRKHFFFLNLISLK